MRVAFEVSDSAAATDRLVAAGAELIAPPVETPWRSLNSRLGAPAGLQITVFQELDRGPR
ncbi:MAG: VOC family protein, partial [Candidatus Limnocylindria bacterium]